MSDIECGVLTPGVMADLDFRLRQIKRPQSPDQLTARLYQICDTLIWGNSRRELFLLAAAIALCGAEACAARDRQKLSEQLSA